MSSVHRLLIVLVLLVLPCSRLPTVAARTDIAAQLYGNAAITRPATPSRLNAALEDLVGSVANFTRLPFNVQRALLWSAGWVQIVSTAPFVHSNANSISKVVYVQVYVLCGRTMSDVFQSSQAFDDTSACELKNCKSNVISYTLSSCDARYVESKTLCALSGEELAASFESMPVKAGPLWSMDGQVDDTFEPQLFQYLNDSSREENVDDDDGEEQRTLYLLAQKESWTMDDTTCPNGAQFIAPCRAVPAATVDVNVQERTWCEPEIELGVKLWVNKAFTATESRSSDLESPPNVSSKVAVVLGLCLGVCVLVSVLFLIMWRRAKSWLKNGLPENEHNTFFVQAHSFQSELAPLEENGGRTGSGHCAEENELCPSLSNALQIEAINESFRMRSPELAAFCDDQELMLKRIAFAGLVYRKRMASGLHGEVWRGEYEGQQVAIKRTNASVAAITAAASASRRSSLALDASVLLSDKELKILVDFTKEIRMAAFLDHPNIVRFVGLSWRTLPDLCMVSEFVALGDLAHFLAQPSGKKLTWKDDKLALAADISNALVYLHSLSPVVLHRDLKSLNILLTKDLQAKLSDFGLSRETSFDGTMTRCVGTPLWTAPEVLRGERYSEKADIYSFGVVLAELDTCLLPYAYSQGRQTKGKNDRDWVPLIASGHATPMFRPDCPRALHELAAQCLDQDPNKRPPAMQIVYLLRSKIPLTL